MIISFPFFAAESMSVITDSWILDLWLLISILIGGIYIFYWYQFQFWKKRNVPHTEPIFFFGDMKKATSITLGLIFKELHHKFKGYSFFGAWIFFKPTIVIRDLDLIKRIMVKDFMSFHDKGIYYNEKEDPFSGKLILQLFLSYNSGKRLTHKFFIPQVI